MNIFELKNAINSIEEMENNKPTISIKKWDKDFEIEFTFDNFNVEDNEEIE